MATFDEDRFQTATAEAIGDAVTAAGATPTAAEFNALVTKFNALLAACRERGILALD